MREAHAIVAKRYGQSYADLICIANPTAVFNGAPLPQQEEPLHLYEDMEAKSNWWSRFVAAVARLMLPQCAASDTSSRLRIICEGVWKCRIKRALTVQLLPSGLGL